MSFLVNILVFFIVFIFYLQLTEQHKKNNDLEVYQLDNIDHKDMHDYCRLKLPIVINYNNVNPEFVSRVNKQDVLSCLKFLQIKNEDVAPCEKPILAAASTCVKRRSALRRAYILRRFLTATGQSPVSIMVNLYEKFAFSHASIHRLLILY